MFVCMHELLISPYMHDNILHINGDKWQKDGDLSIYRVYGLIFTLTSSISGITWIHLSFHKSVACMSNCKLSGLLCSIVPEGIRGSLNGCRILSDCSRQVPEQHQHFLRQWYQHELLLNDTDLIYQPRRFNDTDAHYVSDPWSGTDVSSDWHIQLRVCFSPRCFMGCALQPLISKNKLILLCQDGDFLFNHKVGFKRGQNICVVPLSGLCVRQKTGRCILSPPGFSGLTPSKSPPNQNPSRVNCGGLQMRKQWQGFSFLMRTKTYHHI